MASFANMVIFCRNGGDEGVTFRQPTKADFLGRKSAEHYLLPNPAHEVPMPPVVAVEGGEVEDLLVDSELDEWTQQQTQSAIRHWRIMRKVLPDLVWELW